MEKLPSNWQLHRDQSPIPMPAPKPLSPDAEAAWLAKLDASIKDGEKSDKAIVASLTKSQIAKQQREAAKLRIQKNPIRIIPAPHPATLPSDVLLKACTISKGRASGPGGQNRNKVETLVELLHKPTGIQAHAGERRTAMENRREAIWRLRLALAVNVRCHMQPGDARSPLWRARCPGHPKQPGKIVLSAEHEDFPAMLAEALDAVVSTGLNVKAAAMRQFCTLSQLTKLIKSHPPAMVWLNMYLAASPFHQIQ